MFKEKLINNKRVYYSDILNIEHFFTSRDFEIKEDIEEIAKYLNVEINNVIKPKQVHSINVEFVEENKKDYSDCDGLILDKKNIAIYLNFADCTPVILYDEKNHLASVVHAGWRGTAGKIAPVAFKKMQEKYNSKPNDIIVLIGPAISFEAFETSEDVIKQLKSTIKDDKGLFKDNYADLKGINARQLKEIGIEKIDICPYCTVKDNDKFFSYRKENKTNKRHSALIKL